MPIELNPNFWKSTWTHQLGKQGKIKAAILAAGLGRRMEPLTSGHLPKPMFPLGGKVPMVELWVRRMVDSGIVDISMNLCVLANAIERHFQDGAKFGAHISYVLEEEPSGTFGGVCKQVLGPGLELLPGEDPATVLPAFSGSTVIVPSGDVVTDFGAEHLQQMYEIHRSVGAAVSMILVPVPWERRCDYGTVVIDPGQSGTGSFSKMGLIREFREKDPDSPSNLSNASIYMIEKDLLQDYAPLRTPADPRLDAPFYDFGKHLFPALLGRLAHARPAREYPMWGLQYNGHWFDVGQKRDYIQVNQFLLDGGLDISLPYEDLLWGGLGNGVEIDFAKVTIRAPVVIGNNCRIQPGAVLGPYTVVGDGWVIESDARISRSILWQDYSEDNTGSARAVASGVRVEGSILVGGRIEEDLCDQVAVMSGENLTIVPISFVPEGERA